MVFYKALVKKSIEKREEMDITQAQLAERAGLGEEDVKIFEEGSTNISVESFLKIMDSLNFVLSANSF